MRLNKKQFAVISVLNVIIIALIATILVLRVGGLSGGSAQDDRLPIAKEHIRLRVPSPGVVPQVASETRIMGSGDESIVFVHKSGETVYVFGNASVGDYDFDSYGGFLCRLDSGGKILGFTYFQGKMTAAGVAEGGYCVATFENGESAGVARLYSVDLKGKQVEVCKLDGEAVDILAVGGGRTAIVTMPSENTVKLTEYIAVGQAWTPSRSTRISDGLSLRFFDCYYIGEKYVISARAYNLPNYDSLVFYAFTVGGNAISHYYGGKDESMLTPYSVLPYDGGFLALCKRDGVATVVTVDYGFSVYRRDTLGFAFDDARLVFGGDKYYASFDRQSGAVTYEIDNALNRKILSSTGGGIAQCIGSGVLAIATKTKLEISDPNGTRTQTLAVSGAKVCGIFDAGGNSAAIVFSARGGDDVTKPVGGDDIYYLIVKL